MDESNSGSGSRGLMEPMEVEVSKFVKFDAVINTNLGERTFNKVSSSSVGVTVPGNPSRRQQTDNTNLQVLIPTQVVPSTEGHHPYHNAENNCISFSWIPGEMYQMYLNEAPWSISGESGKTSVLTLQRKSTQEVVPESPPNTPVLRIDSTEECRFFNSNSRTPVTSPNTDDTGTEVQEPLSSPATHTSLLISMVLPVGFPLPMQTRVIVRSETPLDSTSHDSMSNEPEQDAILYVNHTQYKKIMDGMTVSSKR